MFGVALPEVDGDTQPFGTAMAIAQHRRAAIKAMKDGAGEGSGIGQRGVADATAEIEDLGGGEIGQPRLQPAGRKMPDGIVSPDM